MIFKLERKNNTPLVFEGELLSKPIYPYDETTTRFCCNIHLFRTKAGRFVLYIGTRGYGHSLERPMYAVVDPEKQTTHHIVELCGGFIHAKEILELLGKSTEERLE